MILSSPAPQFGQRCMSVSNTCLSSRAQLMRAGPTSDGPGLALNAGCGNAWRLPILGRPLRHHPAEPVDVGTQKLPRHALARHRAAQRQYLVPGALSRWRCGK